MNTNEINEILANQPVLDSSAKLKKMLLGLKETAAYDWTRESGTRNAQEFLDRLRQSRTRGQ